VHGDAVSEVFFGSAGALALGRAGSVVLFACHAGSDTPCECVGKLSDTNELHLMSPAKLSLPGLPPASCTLLHTFKHGSSHSAI
jgi:hypothetical protein